MDYNASKLYFTKVTGICQLVVQLDYFRKLFKISSLRNVGCNLISGFIFWQMMACFNHFSSNHLNTTVVQYSQEWKMLSDKMQEVHTAAT